MAIIFSGKTQCSICHEVLEQGQSIVGTTHFIADPSHPLYLFSDTGMHAKCFDSWDQRDAFSACYEKTRAGLLPTKRTNSDATGKPKFQMAVMGTTDARAEYFDELRSHVL